MTRQWTNASVKLLAWKNIWNFKKLMKWSDTIYNDHIYWWLRLTVFSRLWNFKSSHRICTLLQNFRFHGIMQNLTNEWWLARALFKVVCIFNPCQLTALSETFAVNTEHFRFVADLSWLNGKNSPMTSSQLVCSRGQVATLAAPCQKPFSEHGLLSHATCLYATSQSLSTDSLTA